MFVFNRKALAAIGTAAVAMSGVAILFASPAQAASPAKAQISTSNSNVVEFTAASGQTNSLTITVSGRTITLNDRVAIKAGPGCKAVKGDRTKVRCTTAGKPALVNVSLGNKNDKVVNKTSVPMTVFAGSGNDRVFGGAGVETVFGGSGNDTIHGNKGRDELHGDSGNDTIRGGAGNDMLLGSSGRDNVYGDSGNDFVMGSELDGDIPDGGDWLHGGTGNDHVGGDAGNDRIWGNAGNDVLAGGPGRDQISGGPGQDRIRQGW